MSKNNLADIFTKNVTGDIYEEHVDQLLIHREVISMTTQELNQVPNLDSEGVLDHVPDHTVNHNVLDRTSDSTSNHNVLDRTMEPTSSRTLQMHKSANSENRTKDNKSPGTDRTRTSGDRTCELDSQIGSTRKHIDQALITRYLKGSYIPDNARKYKLGLKTQDNKYGHQTKMSFH